MKNIVVFIYFYKNKNIEKIINVLESKKSKDNNIHYFVYDQNNENKIDKYKKYFNVTYNHIFWDKRNGVSKYRNILLNKNYDYFLEIKNIIDIKNNWDNILIEKEKNNVFVLGNNIENFDIIFMNKKNSMLLKDISFIKFYGKELYLLYLLYINNKNFIHVDKDFVISTENHLHDIDYIPYSLYDGYNQVIEKIKTNLDFVKYILNKYNFNINALSKKYVEEDSFFYYDVVYNVDQIDLDRFNGVQKQMSVIKNIDSV